MYTGGAIIFMNNFDISFFTINDYLQILILIIVSITISFMLILLSYFLVFQKPDSEKLSIYECGYEPYENSRHNFNIQFFLIAVFFMIFDIEILFIMPWTLSVAKSNLLNFWAIIDFIIELGLGFFYIWYNNCLNWK